MLTLNGDFQQRLNLTSCRLANCQYCNPKETLHLFLEQTKLRNSEMQRQKKDSTKPSNSVPTVLLHLNSRSRACTSTSVIDRTDFSGFLAPVCEFEFDPLFKFWSKLLFINLETMGRSYSKLLTCAIEQIKYKICIV